MTHLEQLEREMDEQTLKFFEALIAQHELEEKLQLAKFNFAVVESSMLTAKSNYLRAKLAGNAEEKGQ